MLGHGAPRQVHLDSASSSNAGAPGSFFDTALYDHMRRSVQVFDADGEQVIQLVGTYVTTATQMPVGFEQCGVSASGGIQRRALPHHEPYFPNCRVVLKDATHGARRVLERPWACDPVLKAVVAQVATSRSSIVRRIGNSDVFNAVFQEEFMKMAHNPIATCRGRLKNFSSAVHRFADTVGEPLARVVLAWDAVISSAVRIRALRWPEEEGHDADAFLCFLSERDVGAERYLLLGCMADALDDVIVFHQGHQRHTTETRCYSLLQG